MLKRTNLLFKNKVYVLSIILTLGFVLRFIALDSNPPAMHADEADTGYSALSLVTTGMDPYGNKWPLQFVNQAYNYRPPLYTYLSIPSIVLFGLNPIAERLPSVFFGVVQILVVYILVKKYFNSDNTALISAFIIAINPWAIHISRTGLEVQLSLLLTSAGILFFELSKSKTHFIIFSSILFGLSLFSYHPAKIFTPLILIGLLLFNVSFLKKIKLQVVVASVIFLCFVLTVLYLAVFEKGASHFNDVSIFDNSRAKVAVDRQRTLSSAPLSISSIFSNKPLHFLREFTNVYVGPLSVNYFFINGEGNLDKGTGNYGQYHLFELVPFIIGFYALWRKNKKLFLFITFWFAVSLVPAGITRSGNFAYRDVNALIPPILLMSIGYSAMWAYFIKNKMKIIPSLFFSVSAGIFVFFLYNYYFSYPAYSRDWWGYSQKEAIIYALQNKENYDSIMVHGGLDWAVLYAFYTKLEPQKFQEAYRNAPGIEGEKIVKIDNIYFGPILANGKDKEIAIKSGGKTLLIVPPNFFKDVQAHRVFWAADGGTNLKVYEIQK